MSHPQRRAARPGLRNAQTDGRAARTGRRTPRVYGRTSPSLPDDAPSTSECLDGPPAPRHRLARRTGADRRRALGPPTLPLAESLPGLPPVVTDYLEESALCEALDALGLNPLERAVAEMRIAGATVREIADSSGIRKWRIERALASIRRRVVAARHGALPVRAAARGAAGWQDVYLSETRRRGKP